MCLSCHRPVSPVKLAKDDVIAVSQSAPTATHAARNATMQLSEEHEDQGKSEPTDLHFWE